MAAPTAPPTNPYASMASDPLFSDLFGGGAFSSILNGPEYQSMLSSIMVDYTSLLENLGMTTDATGGIQYLPTATAPTTAPTVAQTDFKTSRTGVASVNQAGSTVFVTQTAGSKHGGTSDSSGPPIGAIVGGVVGGVVAIILLGVLIFCCRRRRRHPTEGDFLIDDETAPVHQVEPFMAPISSSAVRIAPQPYPQDTKGGGLAPPGTSSGYATSSPSSHVSYPSAFPASTHSGGGYTPYTTDPFTPSAGSFPPSTGSFPTSSEAGASASTGKQAPAPVPAPVVEHAVDAGAVPPPVPPKEILPPMYDPSWSGAGPSADQSGQR